MARYLDPKNDFIFKRIFGENPDLLISFLNALMPFEPERHIVSVEYLPHELVPENPGKKDSIVDVRCKDNFNRQFIIEMQIFWTDAFYNRIVFNAGKAYVRQLDKKQNYNLLQPVYTLAILNENFAHKTKKCYHHYQIVNRENSNEVIPGLEFVLVELQKFHPETMSDRKLAVLWLRFLKEVDEDLRKLPPEMQENEYISKAAEICKEAAFSTDELFVYDRYWDSVRIQKTLRDADRAEGRAEGEAITLERIVVEGKIKGFSVEQIQSFTKLTNMQINEILMRYKTDR
jgi:predicted transposase/invertase (TIGR01784 family)